MSSNPAKLSRRIRVGLFTSALLVAAFGSGGLERLGTSVPSNAAVAPEELSFRAPGIIVLETGATKTGSVSQWVFDDGLL